MERKMCCRRSSRPPPALLRAGRDATGSRYPKRGKRASTRWSCCSTAGWCAEGPATLCDDTSVDDEWLQQEEQAHCPEKVVEYVAAAQRCSAARRA